MIQVCTGKIHRAMVTGADLGYEGSVTIDRHLLSYARILPGQVVHINNLANGKHWETYVIPGKAKQGELVLNGPPAHIFQPGDLVVVLGLELVPRRMVQDRKAVQHVVFVEHEPDPTSDAPGPNRFAGHEARRLGW